MAVVSGLAISIPAPVATQTNERLYEELDFRFVTPGARAAGMGSAFVGLADDATAAYSNPAGLSLLLDSEVAFEFTVTQIRHHRLVSTDPDVERTFGDLVLTPSFSSFALPFGDYTLSLFTNRVQDYRETFTIGRRQSPSVPAYDGSAFGTTAVRVDNYGAGLSYVVTPYLSLGASLVIASLDMASKIRGGQPLNPRNGTETIDSDIHWSAIIGLLLKPARRFSLGATYHRGSRFDLTTTLFGSFLERGQDVVRTGAEHDINYVIPDRIAVGVAVWPSDRLVLAADIAKVLYSQQITDKFLVVDFMDSAAELTRDNFFIEDATEFHVGLEWKILWRQATLGFRAGAFTDPDHHMHFVPNDNGHIANLVFDDRFNRLEQRTDVGVSLGFGIAFLDRIQFDVAGTLSRDAIKGVFSTVIKTS